eukprot:TRINITY_DN24030_c0_g1_i1.p1 TRINITY_DN24030_c0_g1~~TRINITY_DN24030_c0_g1_i1.p1  ORF type:complete len:375 (-),score=27.15 TRINITY_DN24030_c0_g1_i1:206-1330(-)
MAAILIIDVLLVVVIVAVIAAGNATLRSWLWQAAVSVMRIFSDPKCDTQTPQEHTSGPSQRVGMGVVTETCRPLSVEEGIERMLASVSPRPSCWLDVSIRASAFEKALSTTIPNVEVEGFAFSNVWFSHTRGHGLVMNINTEKRASTGKFASGTRILFTCGHATISSADRTILNQALDSTCEFLKEKGVIACALVKTAAAMPYAEVRLRHGERGKIFGVVYINHDLPRLLNAVTSKVQNMFQHGYDLCRVVFWWASARGLQFAARNDQSKSHYCRYAWSVLVHNFLEQHDKDQRYASTLTLFQAFIIFYMRHEYFTFGDGTKFRDPFGEFPLPSMLSRSGHKQMFIELNRAKRILSGAHVTFGELFAELSSDER